DREIAVAKNASDERRVRVAAFAVHRLPEPLAHLASNPRRELLGSRRGRGPREDLDFDLRKAGAVTKRDPGVLFLDTCEALTDDGLGQAKGPKAHLVRPPLDQRSELGVHGIGEDTLHLPRHAGEEEAAAGAE